jgi:DTW domain-containing protein YfiP
MSARGDIKNRCGSCRMHETLCICALTPRLQTRTRLALLVHHIEHRKTTNTGSLAVRSLVNSELHVVGLPPGEAGPPPRFASPAVVLFPSPDARPIEDFVDVDGLTLVVPDGTWRQAGRARMRTAGARDLPCVTVPPGPPSRYRLRVERRPGGLSTLEAIARALAVLEGDHVADALLEVFDAMVERTLYSRGALPSGLVSAGVPDEARRLMGHA